jgi:hypothetical protein
MSDKPTQPQQVVLEYIDSNTDDVVCTGVGATREEAEKAAFKDARRRVSEWKAAAAKLNEANISLVAQLTKQSSSKPVATEQSIVSSKAIASFPMHVHSENDGKSHQPTSCVAIPRTVAAFDPQELLRPQTVLVIGPGSSGKKGVITKFVTTLYEAHLDFVSIYGVTKPTASHWFHPYVATRTAAFSVDEMRDEIRESKLANYCGIIILDTGVFNDSTRESLPQLCKEANDAGLTVIIKMNDVNDAAALNVNVHTVAFTLCTWTSFRTAVHRKFLCNVSYSDFEAAHFVAASAKGRALVISGQSWPYMKHFHSDRPCNESFTF